MTRNSSKHTVSGAWMRQEEGHSGTTWRSQVGFQAPTPEFRLTSCPVSLPGFDNKTDQLCNTSPSQGVKHFVRYHWLQTLQAPDKESGSSLALTRTTWFCLGKAGELGYTTIDNITRWAAILLRWPCCQCSEASEEQQPQLV